MQRLLIVLFGLYVTCSALPTGKSGDDEKVISTSNDLVALPTDYHHSHYTPEVHSNKYGDEHDAYGKYVKDYGDQGYNHYGKRESLV